MKDNIRQQTMCFANEFEMAWYLDGLRRKSPRGWKAHSIKKTNDGIYLVIRYSTKGVKR